MIKKKQKTYDAVSKFSQPSLKPHSLKSIKASLNKLNLSWNFKFVKECYCCNDSYFYLDITKNIAQSKQQC